MGLAELGVALMGCELGRRMNDAFEKINFLLDQLEWHLFPIEIKRILPNDHCDCAAASRNGMLWKC